MSLARCSACDLKFASDGSFDRHRVGAFEPDTRRCLSTLELQADSPGGRNGARTEWRLKRRGHWTHQKALSRREGPENRATRPLPLMVRTARSSAPPDRLDGTRYS